jgi:transglutaminase-like putative cysteine protease
MRQEDVLDDDLRACLAPTRFLDCETPEVGEFAARVTANASDPRARAVALFYAVRDGIRYDPYSVQTDPEAYRASRIAQATAAFCVPKAILLAAAARAVGIPARVGFADVRNHLASEKLRARMGTDLFVFHGYADLFLENAWRKATPAFNRELCTRFGVPPLEFDGRADAMLHAFDGAGRRHMEYVRDRGTFLDLPFDEMQNAFREVYGGAETKPSERDSAFHDD